MLFQKLRKSRVICTGRPFGASSERTTGSFRRPIRGVSPRPNNSWSFTDADTLPSSLYSSRAVRPLGTAIDSGASRSRIAEHGRRQRQSERDLVERADPVRCGANHRPEIDVAAGKAQPAQQLLVGAARPSRQPLVGENPRRDFRISRSRPLGERERVVALDGDRFHSAGGGIEAVNGLGGCWLQPFAFNTARDADERQVGLLPARDVRHFERNEKLAVVNTAFARDGRAGARRQPDLRRARGAALRDAVRIP